MPNRGTKRTAVKAVRSSGSVALERACGIACRAVAIRCAGTRRLAGTRRPRVAGNREPCRDGGGTGVVAPLGDARGAVRRHRLAGTNREASRLGINLAPTRASQQERGTIDVEVSNKDSQPLFCRSAGALAEFVRIQACSEVSRLRLPEHPIVNSYRGAATSSGISAAVAISAVALAASGSLTSATASAVASRTTSIAAAVAARLARAFLV